MSTHIREENDVCLGFSVYLDMKAAPNLNFWILRDEV